MSQFPVPRLGSSPFPAASALLVLACAGEPLPTEPVPTATALASAAVVAVPVRISGGYLVVSETAPPPAPCQVLLNATIEGTATHLGRFNGVGSTCVLAGWPPTEDAAPTFTAPGPPPYATVLFSNPRWTLTAANGDELWLEARDAVAVFSLADGSVRARGIHTIIGGTGRFGGATGELETEAVNADGQGADDFESRGWIHLDASKRAN